MKSQIKVLVIPSWYPPDGGYFFKEHCEALAGSGADVEVLVNRVISTRRLGRIRPNQLKRFHDSRENGIRVLRSWMFKIPGNEKWNAKRWIRSTVRLFDKYSKLFGKPDILLAHSAIWAGYAAYRISSANRIPYVIAEHRSFFVFSTEESRKMLRPFYVPMLREVYTNSRQVIIVSESMKPGLLDLDPQIDRHIREIPNMVNGGFFTFPATTRSIDPFVFITSGRLLHVKGFDILIRAFAELVKRGHSNIWLKILGKGKEKTILEKLSLDLKVWDKVIFTGRVSREAVKKELQAANCFVLASRYEAFGVVLIEAMATGLPVIATRSGGPEKIIKPEYGYLVDPENVNGLAQAMQEMIEKYSSFDQKGIRESVLDRYDQTGIASQYIELLKEICIAAG